MISSNRKVRVALLSIISNATLIIFKIVAGIISGSVSIISEAIHSSMDLLASIIAFFSVKASSKPADDDHPFGHGKIENISGVIEGVLILVASIMIIVQAIKKIYNPRPIENEWVAILVMFISGFINFIVSTKLYKVGEEEDSMALKADALHLKTDIYTSLGVGIGILCVVLTGCQKTPEESAVVSKAEGLSASAIAEPLKEGETRETDIPAHWKMEELRNKDRMLICADLDMEEKQ